MKTFGILAAASANPWPPFGLKNFLFSQMAQLADQIGLELCFYSVSEDQAFTCFRYEQGHFRQVRLAWPDLLWDKQLQGAPIPAAIPRFYPAPAKELLDDKWQFFLAMQKHHLPTIITEQLQLDHLHKILAKNPDSLILKPKYGKKGDGIIEIKYLTDQNWLWITEKEFDQLNQDQLTFKLSKLTEQMIVQQKVDTLLFQERPFDIRVLLQRPDKSTLQCTAMGIRLSTKRGISNLAQGGQALPIAAISQLIAKENPAAIQDFSGQIVDICQKAYLAIEESSGGEAIPEIGFDLLVDRVDGPLILEANANPGKWLFVKLADLYPKASFLYHRYWQMRLELLRQPLYFAKNKLAHS